MNRSKKHFPISYQLSELPRVSVVIPNYNNARYLETCINSVLNQTYKNIEIICVDDCSTDNSVNILKSYEQQYSNFRLIRNQTNQKVSKTRHIGILEADSDFITTLDSDDYYFNPEKIAAEMEVIMRYPDENVIAFSGITLVTESGEYLRELLNDDNVTQGDLFLPILTRSCIIPRDFIFAKKLYQNIGGYDINIPIYEDWDLKIRLAKLAKFMYSGVQGMAYRQHHTGLSSARRKIHNQWIKFVFEKNTENLQDRDKLKKLLKMNYNPGILQRIQKKCRAIAQKIQ